MQVLVVENAPANLAALSAWAETLGFCPSVARDAEQARTALVDTPPPLVLLAPGVIDSGGRVLLDRLRHDGLTSALRLGGLRGAGPCPRYSGREVDPDAAVLGGDPVRVVGAAGMLGESPSMTSVYGSIVRVARTQVPVFVFGETGTGKELAARAVHALSPRADGPFIPLNCSAVPRELFESELFGHERGSFTGATHTRRGYCEQAHGGTLFLDELSEMPVDMQAKLLRVVEERELTRVGGEERIAFDARIVAAASQNPVRALERGALREDLYHRLCVFPLELPPLRDRGSDVELLADHFLERMNAETGASKRLAGAARRPLETYAWPGNVRELRNAIERAFILADDDIGPEILPAGGARLPRRMRSGSVDVRVGMSLTEAERLLLEATLDRVDGDKRRAADMLGISLKTVYNRLARYRHEVSQAPLHDGDVNGNAIRRCAVRSTVADRGWRARRSS